jgi:hypothetical protein
MIYFAQNIDTLSIKIGFTNNPKSRLSSFQTGSDSEIILLKTIDGTMDDEKKLHNLFSFCHKRLEWFYPDNRLIAAIKSSSSVDDFLEYDIKNSHFGKFMLLGGKIENEKQYFGLKNQCQIKAKLSDNIFVVQFYDWLMGEPNDVKKINIDDYSWHMIYDNHYDFLKAADFFDVFEHYKNGRGYCPTYYHKLPFLEYLEAEIKLFEERYIEHHG